MASGAAVVLLSALALGRGRPWAPWAAAAVGIWVLFAPLVFWTTSAAAYAVDTLVGTLVIVFAVMVPPQPGVSREALASDADLPLGWSYSPSSYVQRIPIVTLAFVGLFVSRYLAAYQLGHVDFALGPVLRRGRPGGRAERLGGGRDLGCLQGVPDPRRRVRRHRLRPGHPHRCHRRPSPLAHHAVAGAAVRVPDRAPGCGERRLHHHPADGDRHLVHALPDPGGDNRRADPLLGRRGRGHGAVPVAELARWPAVLAHAAAGRPAVGRGPRPRAGLRAFVRRVRARVPQGRGQLPVDAGREHGGRGGAHADRPASSAPHRRSRTATTSSAASRSRSRSRPWPR